MLTRFRTRRTAALLAIAGMTNTAGFLAAQAPVVGGAPGTIGGQGGITQPTRIADCDFTVQHCGGDPTFGDNGGAPPNSTGQPTDASKPECSAGTNQLCGVDTTRVCTQTIYTNGSGNISGSGGVGWAGAIGGSVTQACVSYVVKVRIYYWSKR